MRLALKVLLMGGIVILLPLAWAQFAGVIHVPGWILLALAGVVVVAACSYDALGSRPATRSRAARPS